MLCDLGAFLKIYSILCDLGITPCCVILELERPVRRLIGPGALGTCLLLVPSTCIGLKSVFDQFLNKENLVPFFLSRVSLCVTTRIF